MKEYVNIRMLINTLQEAWIGTDKLIGFVEEHDRRGGMARLRYIYARMQYEFQMRF